jgi:hypothetical protein
MGTLKNAEDRKSTNKKEEKKNKWNYM